MFQPERQTVVNGQMSEDEALARALQASLNESSGGASQQQQLMTAAPQTREEQDRMLAQALAESEREANRATGNKSSCGIS